MAHPFCIMTKRITFWITLICIVVAAIFLLTLQDPDGTIAISVEARGLLTRLVRLLAGNASWQISIHDVRRLAHVPEYGLLGLVVCIGLNRITGRIGRSAVMTPAFCFVISLADQIVKWMLRPGISMRPTLCWMPWGMWALRWR